LPQNKTIRVVGANRNLADILRTLAHELTHYKQLIENRIKPNSGKTGSTEENEANAMAGELLREFGRANPVIFE
jgi:Zn-dependent peptidase ImmA (M78 family)